MGLSVMARRVLRAAAIITMASATAFGVFATAAGAAGQAPGGAAAPVPYSALLSGVSCPTASMCLVVGESVDGAGFIPAAAVWNGKTWRWMAQPPDVEPNSGLDAVTCQSASRCIAVGSSDATDSAGQGVAFGDEWNGTTWRRMPPLAGTTFTQALGLSCLTTKYCVAVGGSNRNSPMINAIAELWNGVSWSQMTPVIPTGTTSIIFDGVSCTSPSHCLAVGSYYHRHHVGESAVAELWNGSTWTMLPAAPGVLAFAGVSCPQPDLCLAVGRGPVVALWNGTKWREAIKPNAGELEPSLTEVSCATATNCIAVGTTFVGRPIAYRWTGGVSTRKLSIPNLANELTGLYAVSCTRSSACLAVGSPVGEFTYGGDISLAWNGTKWRVIRQNNSDALVGVSCLSRSDCLAVGNYLDKSDVTRTLGQAWNGRAWRLAIPPAPVGDVVAVSCLSSSFCMASGLNGAGTWNGTRWEAITAGRSVIRPPALSCTSRSFCVATSTQYAMAMWHGLKWRSAKIAYPASAASVGMSGVSCTSSSFCMAVGAYSAFYEGGPAAPLVNVWNGSRWQIVSTPNPEGNSGLTGVSCVSPSACTAVGLSFVANDAIHNLAMTFTNGKWQAFTMPGPASRYGSSVSCSVATSCVAVGYFSSRRQGMADVWNGTAWRLTKPAVPGALPNSVSCTTPTFCIAVGSNANLQLAERWNGHAWKLLSETNP